MSCWTILGISEDADKIEIKKAFARLVKQYPPEGNPGKYQEIRQAYNDAIKACSARGTTSSYVFDESSSWITEDRSSKKEESHSEIKKETENQTETEISKETETEISKEIEIEKKSQTEEKKSAEKIDLERIAALRDKIFNQKINTLKDLLEYFEIRTPKASADEKRKEIQNKKKSFKQRKKRIIVGLIIIIVNLIIIAVEFL